MLTSGGFGGVLYNIIYYIYFFLSHTTALKNVLHLLQMLQLGVSKGSVSLAYPLLIYLPVAGFASIGTR